MKKDKNGLIFLILEFTTFFNVWIPKAGIKINELPITLGNVSLALLLIIWITKKIKNGRFSLNRTGLIIIFSIFIVLLKCIVIMASNSDIFSYIAYVITLTVYPLIYLISCELLDTDEKKEKIIKIMFYGFIFVCLYSILQFVFGIEKCCIPGITVNLTDYKEMGQYWYLMKNNGIGEEEAKIVSTYQNGNLFGINLLIIYPIIYGYLKQKNKKKLLVFTLLLFFLTVALTLSRACWLGLILFVFFGIILKKSTSKRNFFYKILFAFLTIFSIVLIFEYVPMVANRFFNTKMSDWISMSGRTEGLISILNSVRNSNKILPWLIGPNGLIQYSGIAYEILPLSLFVQIGIIGVVVVYSIFLSSIKVLSNDDIGKNVKISLIVWLIVGLIECGFWLPPTAINLYLVMSLGIDYKKEVK